jgi:hypothetical protein
MNTSKTSTVAAEMVGSRGERDVLVMHIHFGDVLESFCLGKGDGKGGLMVTVTKFVFALIFILIKQGCK